MNKGFTLIELLIAMAVSGVIMAGVFSAFKSQQDSYLAQDQVAEMQQNLRAGLYVMTSELRMAGYDPAGRSAGIVVANPTNITFTFVADNDGVDNNANGTIDEPGELKTVQYDHYDANSATDLDHLDLGREVGGVNKRAVAENIEQLEFYYTLADGTKTTTPTSAQLDDIRAVEISILAITGRNDRGFINNQTYTSASGADWTPASPDNFRRRLEIMTVNCRNMGL